MVGNISIYSEFDDLLKTLTIGNYLILKIFKDYYLVDTFITKPSYCTINQVNRV